MGIRLFVLFCLWPFLAHAQVHTLYDNDQVQEIEELEYFIDDDLKISRANIADVSFQKAPDEGLRLDDVKGQLWLRIRLYNPHEERLFRILEFTDPSLFEVVLYENDEGATFSGTSIPQDVKDYQGNDNAFLVDTGPGETEDLYIRIRSNNYVTASATISPEPVYHENEIDEYIFLGVFHGVLLLIAGYSLFLFLLTKSRVFLIYGIYIFGSMFFTGTSDGMTPMYFRPLVVATNGYLEVIISAFGNVMALLLTSAFLKTKEWSPRIHRILKIAAVAIAGIIVFLLIFSPKATFGIMRLVGLLNLGLILAVSYRAIKNRVSQSRFYFVSFLGYGFFILLFILNLFRLVPFGYLVQYAIHFGILFNLIVLSVAMGMRVYRQYARSIEEEREKQEQFSIKNEELEKLVAERTEAINKKENELRSILDNSDNLIWLVDRGYVVREMNAGFAQAWQLSFGKELLRGSSILEQMDNPKEKNAWRKRYDKVFAGKSFSFSEVYEMGPQALTFEVNAYPIRENDKIIAAAMFSRNITDRLAYEQELKNKNLALQQVNEELDSFVYSASHDLKAPLASIQGLIGLVRHEKDMDERVEYYDMMDKSIKRLDQFIRDIIDYSRNTRIEVKTEEIDVSEMVESVLDDLKFMSDAELQVEIVKNEDEVLVADPTRLRIIFRNLLSNAFSYGVKEGEDPYVRIRWNIKNTKAIIEICDHGPGIPDEHKEHIFDMFYRANETSSGSGLGLYIVRESVRKMNGSVSMDSSAAGTCFRIAFPNRIHT